MSKVIVISSDAMVGEGHWTTSKHSRISKSIWEVAQESPMFLPFILPSLFRHMCP